MKTQTVVEALTEHLEKWDLSQAELARYMGVPQQLIHRLAKGRARLQMREAVLLDDVFGTERMFWWLCDSEQRYQAMVGQLKRRGKRISQSSLAKFRAGQELTK